jgi:acetyl-CoA C-acetyltransferase
MTTVICSPKRTAIGSFLGSLSSVSASQLGATTIKASLTDSKLNPDLINEVFMGCVLTSGLGQAPARQAAIFAGLNKKTPCTTIGKVCGSGLKAVMLADSAIRAGDIESAIAGGMESMSQSPYLISKARSGLRMGPGELIDSMIKDGLWDVYNNFHMGSATEILNREHKISREAQDEFAVTSYKKALDSIATGVFKEEITPVMIEGKKGALEFSVDEEPGKSDLAKITTLKPVFSKDGSVTAANASSINDGAAAMIVCSEEFAKKQNLKPLARIVAQAQSAGEPEWFTTAPTSSIKRVLEKAKMSSSQIDLWEINEAFSAVALANMKLLELDPTKVNPFGGSVALGHPIGASGARILTTLLYGLKRQNKKFGCASLCIGGGEAVAVVVERLS